MCCDRFAELRARVAELEKERDALKCCGNCYHIDQDFGDIDCEKNRNGRDDGISIFYDAPACEKWKFGIK